MKITKQYLRKIIKEEAERVLRESQRDAQLQEIFNEMMSSLGVDPLTAAESGFSWEIYTGRKGLYFQLNIAPAGSDILNKASPMAIYALKDLPLNKNPSLFAESDDVYTSKMSGNEGYWSYKLAPKKRQTE